MEKVIRVVPQDDFRLLVTFNTGETKLFDARPYLEKGVFTKLKKPELFKQVYVAFDTVCWPGDLDIAPETLYDASIPMCVNEDSPEYGVNNDDAPRFPSVRKLVDV